MKKNFFRRTISFLFVFVTLFGTIAPMTLTSSAAEATKTATSSITGVSVDTSKNFCTVNNSAILRSSTSIFYSKLATLNKGALIQTSGSSGDFYKVKLKMDGKNTVYYIKKSELKAAPKNSTATFCYAVKSAPLRQAPCDNGTKLATAAKGTVIRVLGKLVNDHGNDWYIVLTDSNQIAYVYASNVKTTKKITLSVTGNSFITTGNPVNFKYSVSPSGITGIKWSSSNSNIAKVNGSGAVTGVAGGDTIITAKLGNFVSTSLNVNVALNVAVYRQSTNYTCSAASTMAVLRYNGKATKTTDKDLYPEINGYVYAIRDVLNSYLGKNTYCWKTFKSIDAYESVIRTSLAQNSPVIARVAFNKGYYNYTSKGHYTTIVGVYEKNGKKWVICVDSFVDRYKSNSYCNAETGIVHVPLEDMYYYNSYCGRSDRYLIYNP